MQYIVIYFTVYSDKACAVNIWYCIILMIRNFIEDVLYFWIPKVMYIIIFKAHFLRALFMLYIEEFEYFSVHYLYTIGRIW